MIVYVCPNGHVSSVRRPGGVKADKCFFCSTVVEPKEATLSAVS